MKPSLRSVPKDVRAPGKRGRPSKYDGGSEYVRGTVSKQGAKHLAELAANLGGDISVALDQALKVAALGGSKGIQAAVERRRHEEAEQSLLDVTKNHQRIIDTLTADRDRILIELRRASFFANRRVNQLSAHQLERLQNDLTRMEGELAAVDGGLAILRAWSQHASPSARRNATGGVPPPPAKTSGADVTI